MATQCSQTIDTDIQSLDYEAVSFLYNCIYNSLTKIGINKIFFFRILYRMGNIGFETNDFEEFLKKAYGQNPVISHVYISGGASFLITTTDSKRDITTKQREHFVSITINCDDSILLSKLVIEIKKQIEMQKIDSNIPQQSISVIVGHDLNMEGSAIGNGNSITNTKNETKNETGFWKGIGQSILSNFIWLVLSLIILGFITYIGVR